MTLKVFNLFLFAIFVGLLWLLIVTGH